MYYTSCTAIFYRSACLAGSLSESAPARLCEEAEQMVKCSELFKYKIDNFVLRHGAKRMREQADEIDMALARFISETHGIRIALEEDLHRVIKQRLSCNRSPVTFTCRTLKACSRSKYFVRSVARFKLFKQTKYKNLYFYPQYLINFQ